MSDLLSAPTRPDVAASTTPEELFEPYRRELTAHCYRVLGSSSESEDAVQETLVKAWRAYDRFEGRSSVRTWLYRIATNVCLDMLDGAQRRARPMEFGGPSSPDPANLAMRPEGTWVEPIPDGITVPSDGDPAEQAAVRDSIRLAFVAALQHLPPRQRVVLLLREVLRWQASEVAELLGTTVASVNSALQRARATLADRDIAETDAYDPLDQEQSDLLERYLQAFEQYDMDALTSLLREDATMNMPPYDLWLEGQEDIVAWMVGPGAECEGSRLVPTVANGAPAFGQYRRSADGGHEPWALQVLELRGGRIACFNAYLDTARWFPMFGLPERL